MPLPEESMSRRKVFYDLCDTYSCLKAIQLAAWRNFNGAMLPQLDAAAQILGVEYEKVDRGE